MKAWPWPGIVVALALAPACGGSGARVPRFTGSGNLRVTVDAWVKISKPSGAIAVTATGAVDVPEQMKVVNREGIPTGGPVDLVYVVDTTGSMGDDIDAAKAQMRSILGDLTRSHPD